MRTKKLNCGVNWSQIEFDVCKSNKTFLLKTQERVFAIPVFVLPYTLFSKILSNFCTSSFQSSDKKYETKLNLIFDKWPKL